MDPRILEKTLNACPVVAHSAVIGNNLIAGPADYVCAIIELHEEDLKNLRASVGRVTKTLSIINYVLAPPLRIAWSRVLILDRGQSIPYTKKRTVFRKKLQDMFGEQLSRLLMSLTTRVAKPVQSVPPVATAPTPTIEEAENLLVPPTPSGRSIPEEEARRVVFDTLCNMLGVSSDVLRANSQSTFAEVILFFLSAFQF